MRTTALKRIRRPGRAAFLIALAILVAAPAFCLSGADGPEAWLDQWVSEKGTTRIELRQTEPGRYDFVVVWVSPDADDRVKASLGKPMAAGFAWDAAKGEFRGGRLTDSTGGDDPKAKSVECRLIPKGADTLEFIAKLGILSKTIPWTRVGKTAPR